jgi:Haem-degrading
MSASAVRLAASAFTLSLAASLATPANAELLAHKDLSLDTALTIASTAAATCKQQGYRVSVHVVGRYGEVVVALRGDNASPHTFENSMRKAYTARTFRVPSGGREATEPRSATARVVRLARRWHRLGRSSFEARSLRSLAPQDDGSEGRPASFSAASKAWRSAFTRSAGTPGSRKNGRPYSSRAGASRSACLSPSVLARSSTSGTSLSSGCFLSAYCASTLIFFSAIQLELMSLSVDQLVAPLPCNSPRSMARWIFGVLS